MRTLREDLLNQGLHQGRKALLRGPTNGCTGAALVTATQPASEDGSGTGLVSLNPCLPSNMFHLIPLCEQLSFQTSFIEKGQKCLSPHNFIAIPVTKETHHGSLIKGTCVAGLNPAPRTAVQPRRHPEPTESLKKKKKKKLLALRYRIYSQDTFNMQVHMSILARRTLCCLLEKSLGTYRPVPALAKFFEKLLLSHLFVLHFKHVT